MGPESDFGRILDHEMKKRQPKQQEKAVEPMPVEMLGADFVRLRQEKNKGETETND